MFDKFPSYQLCKATNKIHAESHIHNTITDKTMENQSGKKTYLLWPNSHKRENSSQLKGGQTPSVKWLAKEDSPEVTRDSPRWTVIGKSCSFTNKPASDPPSLDMSTRSSLISTVAFGVCSTKIAFNLWVKGKLRYKSACQWIISNTKSFTLLNM